jgi:hypothetical protein
MLQVNATSTVVATALAGNKTATAGALSDMATASAQQTAIAVGGPVTATALAHATATAVVQDRSPGYFASSGKMFYDEPLDSAGAGWDNQADSKGDTCQFSYNAYHISETRVGYSFRCVDIGQISGGPELVEVEMMIVKGNCAGLYIRVSKTSNYPFFVCQNGFADIDDHSNTNNNDTILGKAGPGAFRLKAGWNTIGLEVNSNNTIMGYVNGQRIITVQDDGTTNIGEFALAAAGTKTATEVAYRNLRAWLTSSSSMSLS